MARPQIKDGRTKCPYCSSVQLWRVGSTGKSQKSQKYKCTTCGKTHSDRTIEIKQSVADRKAKQDKTRQAAAAPNLAAFLIITTEAEPSSVAHLSNFVRIKEAARRRGVSRTWLEWLVKIGRVPSHVEGNKVWAYQPDAGVSK